MPNYLEGDNTNGGWFVESANGKIEDDKSNFDNLSTKASIQNDTRGLQQVGFGFSFGPQGGGSRPEALHTEFATGASDGPAYGSRDIVFYLQRADADQENSPQGEEPGAKKSVDSGEQSDTQNPNMSLSGSTGDQPDSGQVPSGANQLASGGVGRSLGETEGGPMAPIGGMSIDDEVDIGTFTQNAAMYVDVSSAAANAVRRVESLGSDQLKISLASSERMFANIMNRSFNPDEDLSGIRDADSILMALSRPSLSELSFQLAQAAGGRCRAKDVVKAVNDGEIGLVNAKARAFQGRMGAVRGSNR